MPTSDNDRKLGRDLAVRLVERAYPELYDSDRDIYLPDVLESVEAFKLQARILGQSNRGFPCLAVDQSDSKVPIPLSLGLESVLPLLLPEGRDFFDSLLARLYDNLFELMYRRGPGAVFANWGTDIKTFSGGEATSFLEDRLSDFLAVRFSSRQSNVSAQPGALFSVSCSPDLRAYYTPTYWLQVKRVLNYPTPTSGWVQPGRYYFGAAQLGQSPRFDFSAYYDIPPDNHAQLPF